MPSRFEPCGLLQMMAMRYGTVPVVHAVGGLRDTVREGENGFLFERYDVGELVRAVRRALRVYKTQNLESKIVSPKWSSLVRNGMKGDFSWSRSARKYLDLYRKALEYHLGVPSPRLGEYRRDELTGEWVIVSGERQRRTGDIPLSSVAGLREVGRPEAGKVKGCPFDEGNEAQTPPEVLRIGPGVPNGPGWEVRVVPNKFPILQAHEVIIHSPSHECDLADLPLSQVEKIIQAYVFRFRHYDGKGLPYIFSNHGPDSGASLNHPHSQLIVFERIPEAISEELEKAKEYYRVCSSCPYCDLIKREAGGGRFVFENSHFLVVVPLAAEWPYELLILPKTHRANFSNIEPLEVTALAEVLKKVCGAMIKKFSENLSYNFWIHSLSTKFLNEEENLFYHWHLEFIPRLKKLGGIELGAEVMVYDRGTPEDAARELRLQIS